MSDNMQDGNEARAERASGRRTRLWLAGTLAGVILLCVDCSRGAVEKRFAPHIRRGEPALSPQGESYAHYLAAVVYERTGNFEKSIAEMKKASEASPNSPAITLHLLEAYIRNQDFANALQMSEKALEQQPENAALWILCGELYHRVDRYDDAVRAFQKALELDPENLLGLGQLAAVQERTNDLVASIDIYQRLVVLSPKSAPLHLQLGWSLVRIKSYEDAEKSLKTALQLNPKLAQAHFLLGVIYLEQNKNDRAVGHFAAALKLNPSDERAQENLAGALARIKRYGDSLEIMKLIMRSGKDEPRHAITALYLMLRTTRYAEARDLTTPPQAPILGTFLRALALRGLAQPNEAVLKSLDSIEGNLDEECMTYLDEVLYLFGDADVSGYFLDTIEGLVREGATSKSIEYIRARILMKTKRMEEAEKALLDILKKYGEDKLIHSQLAIIYDSMKRVEETEQHLNAYLAIDPLNPEILNFLGYFYADRNMKLDEAEALLKKALDLDPGNPFYTDSLGWVYYRKGDGVKAVELIRKAIQTMESDDAVLREHLGDAYLLKGDKDKALAEWERARRLDPTLQGLADKIKKHRK